MRLMSGLRILAVAIMAFGASAVDTSAQITTGNITGTVKDAQGGVVPGATVTLIDEAKGTRLAPATTDQAGNYVFPNITPATYTVEVTMDGFKTSQRKAVPVSGGDRVSVPAITLEVGGTKETVTVVAESPLIQAQSGERSFSVTTEQVENLPIQHGNFTSLTQLTPGVQNGGNSAGATRIGGAGQNNIMMDGISAMDTGNNGQMLNMNIESIAEVKVLTQGYQAEYGRSSGLQITAVTKSGTNRFRGSAYDLITDSDWNTNRHLNVLNGDPKPIASGEDPGLLHRRPGRQARRSQQAVLLLQPRVPPDAQRDQQRQPDSPAPADGGRARRRLLADPRPERRALQLHQGSDAVGRVQRDRHQRLFPGWRRARQDPAEPSLRPRGHDPEPLSDAEPDPDRRAATTTTRSAAPASPTCRLSISSSSSRRFASTTSCRRSCASPASTPATGCGR